MRADTITYPSEDFDRYLPLGRRILDQAQRRVLWGEIVPATEKLYSIFEEHTELLKRGKAGKPIEFGHMVHFQQVEGKYITDYEVFLRKPNERTLVDPALDCHRALFGADLEMLSADKGYYESMEKTPVVYENSELDPFADLQAADRDSDLRLLWPRWSSIATGRKRNDLGRWGAGGPRWPTSRGYPVFFLIRRLQV